MTQYILFTKVKYDADVVTACHRQQQIKIKLRHILKDWKSRLYIYQCEGLYTKFCDPVQINMYIWINIQQECIPYHENILSAITATIKPCNTPSRLAVLGN